LELIWPYCFGRQGRSWLSHVYICPLPGSDPVERSLPRNGVVLRRARLNSVLEPGDGEGGPAGERSAETIRREANQD